MTGPSREETKAIVAGLKKSTLLGGLKESELRRLAGYAKVRTFPQDVTVVHRAEKGIGFYMILEGNVRVRKGSTTLARLGPGDFFGELALFDNRPRSADVITSEPTTVVVLSRYEFWGFASERPEILRTILEVMARRLSQTERVPVN